MGCHGSKPASRLMAAFALAAALAAAGAVTLPAAAVADALDVHPTTHVVIFQSQGSQTQHVTTAQTVGEFLALRGIAPKRGDYVHPSADTPLSDNIIVAYAPAIPVTLVTAHRIQTIVTTAQNVGAFLEDQGIALGPHDVVRPSLSAAIAPNGTVRIACIIKRVVTHRERVAERTVHVIDFALPPGKTRVVHPGKPGVMVTMVDYTSTDGRVRKRILEQRVIVKPETRVVAVGVGTGSAIADFARKGLERTSYIASDALDMVATAYTAGCEGCDGYTASGYRAGHGIVAVDPRVIPLGTKLYIPGYGFAIAGDTGGAIVGDRIDLGFDSLDDAIHFGRRDVKVYTLQ
jgi:3D (Asp-Asp-Asp) domain-containing protein